MFWFEQRSQLERSGIIEISLTWILEFQKVQPRTHMFLRFHLEVPGICTLLCDMSWFYRLTVELTAKIAEKVDSSNIWWKCDFKNISVRPQIITSPPHGICTANRTLMIFVRSVWVVYGEFSVDCGLQASLCTLDIISGKYQENIIFTLQTPAISTFVEFCLQDDVRRSTGRCHRDQQRKNETFPVIRVDSPGNSRGDAFWKLPKIDLSINANID